MTDLAFCRHFQTEEAAVRALRKFFSKGCPSAGLPETETANWLKCQKQAYAEALLWNCFHHTRQVELPSQMASFCPFGPESKNYPPLGCLCAQPGVVALFPICSDTVSRVCFMYLFKKQGLENFSDHRSLFAGNSIISNDVLIYVTGDFSPLTDRIDGNSWQLAYCMALKLLNEKVYDRKLLTYFLLTGAVNNNNEVKAVEKIDKKTELLHSPWTFPLILPESNQKDIPDGIDPQKYHTVSDTNQAWRLISKTGFSDVSITLPEKISELHILVGGAKKPAIYTILLLNPEKVFLWHSSETFEIAQSAAAYFQDYPALNIEFDFKKMDSGKLQNCYRDLDLFFQTSSRRAQSVINVTGGNRLMGFAALLIAQTYNIKVIYRDRDAEEEQLTAISFSDNKRCSGPLKCNRCPEPVKSQIDWQELLKTT